MAGLSAAVALVKAGRPVTLYEAGVQAGGRCRSYHDQALDCRLDNGNHLLLACNTATLSYLEIIGASDTLVGPDETIFPFMDLRSGERWTLSMNRGRIPWWLFDKTRRVPGSRPGDYLEALKLIRAPEAATVAERLKRNSALFERLWQPLAIAIMNTEVETASARLLGSVFAEMFGGGGAACRPLAPREGLSESLVDPALAWLAANGADIRFGERLRGMGFSGDRVATLSFPDGEVALADGEAVVIAVPAPVAAMLMPDVATPVEFRAIVNAHYRVDIQPTPGAPNLIGLIGGTAEWIFVKDGLLSVTISAADRLVDMSAEELAPLIWRDVATAYGLDAGIVPAHRIVKEKRATFAATPAQQRLRPGPTRRWRNLCLAGDWTATGLPSTIEGAIRSGQTAARQVVAIGRAAR
jgi:squalene-associated FAD-dependent desaturase